MSSSRSTVFIAIVIGALVGAVGAVMSQRAGPETRAEPPPLATTAPPTANPAAAPKASTAATTGPAVTPVGSSSAAAGTDPIAEAIAPLKRDPAVLSRTELHCARGNPDDCLLVGDFYARSDVKDDHMKRALIYRRRAIVLYAEKCHDRWPAECKILSHLYEKGVGVPRNNRTAEALLQRSLELCKAHPTRPCVREPPPDVR